MARNETSHLRFEGYPYEINDNITLGFFLSERLLALVCFVKWKAYMLGLATMFFKS